MAFETLCTDRYESCLQQIENQLVTSSDTQHHLQLLLKKAQLLSTFSYCAQAQQILEPLRDEPLLSDLERAEVVVYLAKNYYVLNDQANFVAMATEAEHRLDKMAFQTLRWELLVAYSDILIYNNKLKESWSVLSVLQKRSHDGIPDEVMADIYANLARLAEQLERFQQWVEYSKKAYRYTIKQHNLQQIGIAAHNLAFAYVSMMDYRRGKGLYERAIASSTEAGDSVRADYSRFHLAEMRFLMGDLLSARRDMVALMAKDLSHNHLLPLEKLQRLLSDIDAAMIKGMKNHPL